MYNCLALWSNMASQQTPTAGIKTVCDPSSESASTSNGAPGTPQEIRKIYVGNLSTRITAKQLELFFSVYGKVQNAHFARTKGGIKPNYAFVTFYEPADAMSAIRAGQLGQIRIHGRRLMVNEADQKYQPCELPNGRIKWNVWSSKALGDHFFVDRPKEVIDESKCMVHLLNDDCLRLIFSFLPKRDLIKSERVCKHWQAICRAMWLTTKVLSFSKLDLRRQILNMHVASQLLDRIGPNLVTLDLSYKPSDLHSSVLALIADACPNLGCLNLTSVPLTLAGLRAVGENCKALQHINLEFCFGVKDKELEKFFRICNHLESVVLSHNTSLTGRCLEGLHKDTIQDLSLNNCTSLDSNLTSKFVGVLTNLRVLNIDSLANLTSRDMSSLCQSLTQLRTLSMRHYYPHISHRAFRDLSHLRELVTLNLSQNSTISDDILEVVAKNCKKLKSIDITGCSVHTDQTVTDCGIAAIAKLPQLTNLKMSYMAVLTDASLVSLAEKTNKLQTLECRGCPTFHDFGCSRIVTLCNQLRLFDFSGCDEVSNDTITSAVAAVKLRTNHLPLKLVVGGTFVDEDFYLETDLLQLDFNNFCIPHMRPDFVDNHYFLSESDDDDDFDDLYDVDFDVVGSPAMFFGDDLGEYYGYLAYMENQEFDDSDYDEYGDYDYEEEYEEDDLDDVNNGIGTEGQV